MATDDVFMRLAPKKNDRTRLQESYNRSCGVAGDPLCYVASLFASLVHAVAHPGVPNAIFVQEDPETARQHGMESCGVQESFDTAWYLLIEPHFADLQGAIFGNHDKATFRQLALNLVLAADEEVIARSRKNESNHVNAARFLRYSMQSSVMSHAMQPWEGFLRWNERMFEEKYKAFQEDRSLEDPTRTWFKETLDAFNSYLFPLALRKAKLFGIHNGMAHVKSNREQWIECGSLCVDAMKKKAQSSYGAA